MNRGIVVDGDIFKYFVNDVETALKLCEETKIEIEREEKKNMNKILDLYASKKLEKINEKYIELVEKEFNENEFVKQYKVIVENFENDMQMLYENSDNLINQVIVDTGVSGNNFKYDISIDLRRKIAKKYEEEKRKEVQELDNLISEINATLTLAENGNGEINQDRVIEILSNYQIIDKKTLKIKE